MKIIVLVVALTAVLTAAEIKKPIPLTDAEARAVREDQLAVASALLAQTEAAKQAQKAVEDAQAALSLRVQKLQKASGCDGCRLGNDLKWIEPEVKKVEPEVKKEIKKESEIKK